MPSLQLESTVNGGGTAIDLAPVHLHVAAEWGERAQLANERVHLSHIWAVGGVSSSRGHEPDVSDRANQRLLACQSRARTV